MEKGESLGGGMIILAIILAIILWLYPAFIIYIAWLAVILLLIGGLVALIFIK